MSDDDILPGEDLRPGDKVAGRYRIESLLGEGGMGLVYRAVQLGLEREVALKVIRPQTMLGAQALARFEREARAASLLKHPGAVEIYDYGEDRGMAFLAMQLVEGRSLGDLIAQESPLPVETCVRIASDIADVLVAAEAIGLVHRDLKPDNVLLERSAEGAERVVVVDFGLAFVAHRPGVDRMTREGIVTGTPDYMSPEQVRGVALDSRTDVYALGCILFEMLTCNPPFEGDTVTLLARHLFMAPPKVDECRDGPPAPRALSRLLDRMLQKEVDVRPRAYEVREALGTPSEAKPERMGVGTTGQIQARAQRMISVAPRSERITYDSPTDPRAEPVAIRIVGEVGPNLAIGLAANGIRLVEEEGDAVYAPGAPMEELEALVQASARPVLTTMAPSETARLAGLLRAGAAEVLVEPVAPEALAHKVSRAVRAARRQHKREADK